MNRNPSEKWAYTVKTLMKWGKSIETVDPEIGQWLNRRSIPTESEKAGTKKPRGPNRKKNRSFGRAGSFEE